jgi:uncharacterized protein
MNGGLTYFSSGKFVFRKGRIIFIFSVLNNASGRNASDSFLYLTGMKTSFTFILAFFWCLMHSNAQQKSTLYEIKQDQVYVPMKDSVRLWACMTRPVSKKKKEKFPALLVMDPYAEDCKLTRYNEAFLSGNGYVVCTFHVRGSGKSEGKLFDREYSEQEIQDAVAIIDWLSKQSWSNGAVGMYGGSWSAFNAIETAMRKPRALKAIISYVGTEDLYNEDVHYADGVFRFDDYIILADMFCYTPPPLNSLDEMILQNRFDQPPLSLTYLKHQSDGEFWRKDIRLNIHPDTLKVPTLMVGGWYDGYRTAILRALQNIKAPIKAIVGPWDHSTESPEPSADLKKFELRWWDYWLKKKPTGIMNDPDLTVYMRKTYQPVPAVTEIPGQWQSFTHWPPADLKEQVLYFNSDRLLSTQPASKDSAVLKYIPTSGNQAGIWWGNVMPDQRAADAFSLVFESEPVKEQTAILGQPIAKLLASATAPHANWYVKLSDVAPDGTVSLITGAGLNGTHRNSAVKPEWLERGKEYPLTIPLHFTSWVFEPGHRIRVSVTNALWPMFWPTPYPMNTTLLFGEEKGSFISLPVVKLSSPEEAEKIANYMGSRNILSAKIIESTKESNLLHSWPGAANIYRDELNRKTTVNYKIDYEDGELVTHIFVEYAVKDDGPANASVKATIEMKRTDNGHVTEWKGATTIISDLTYFHYSHERELIHDGERIRQREWKEDVKRDFQ